MAGKPLDLQAGFAGGWNVSNPLIAPEDEYQSALNMRLKTTGELVTRGQTRRTTAAVIAGASVLGGFSWRKGDASIQELILCNGHLYTATLTGPLLTALTDRGGGFSTSQLNLPTWAHFRNAAGVECVYFTDDTSTKLSKWDGAALSVHSVGPNVQLSACWVFNGRLFAVSGSDQILYFSALNNGDTLGDSLSGGGFLTIRAFGASRLVGGAGIGSALLLCHAAGVSVFRGTTSDDISIDLGQVGVSEGIGAVGQQAIHKFDGFAYLTTAEGIYVANEGGVVAMDSPQRADPLLRGNDTQPGSEDYPIPNENVAPFTYSTQFYIARHPRFQELWFGAGSDYTRWQPRVYNYELKRWIGVFDFSFPLLVPGVPPDKHFVRAAWDTVDNAGRKQLLLGCSDGYVRLADSLQLGQITPNLEDLLSDGTGGTAFPVSMTCRRFWGGRPTPSKIWRALNVWGKLEGNSLSVRAGGQHFDAVTATLAPPNTIVPDDYAAFRHTGVPKSSQYLDVGITATSSEPKVLLAGVEVEGEIGADRGV